MSFKDFSKNHETTPKKDLGSQPVAERAGTRPDEAAKTDPNAIPDNVTPKTEQCTQPRERRLTKTRRVEEPGREAAPKPTPCDRPEEV